MLGFHQGDWIREDPANCVLIQTCDRCHTINQRIEHDWSESRYRSEQDCVLERACKRCAEKEARVEHRWGSWTYRSEVRCEQGIQCARCAAWSEDQRVEHEWGEWKYNERYRAPLHACVRCSTLVSYFPEQSVASAPNGRTESPRESVQQLISDDGAVAEIVVRAQGQRQVSPVATSESKGSDEDPHWQKHGLEELRRLYEEQVRSGVISSERRPLLNALLAELDDVIQRPGSTLAEKQINARRLQDAMLRLGEALLNPSRGTQEKPSAADTRLALITELHNNLQRYLYNETAAGNLTSEEGRAGMALLGELRDSREVLANLAPDGDPLNLESETLRQTALNIRTFSLRHHLMLVSPIWPTHSTAQNPSAVFYSGGSEVGDLLGSAATSRKLRCLTSKPTHEPASLRWNQLREAVVGVFDFTTFKRNAGLEEMSAVANVAYELGIALALGRPAIIVASEHQDLPFDLDVEPVRINPQGDASAQLGRALDEMLYGLQRSRAGSSVAASIEFLRSQYQSGDDFRVHHSLASIDADVENDPVKARLLIASSLGFVGAGAPQMAFPSWPGDYPNGSAKRCFHVTAFGPDWASTTSEIIAGACGGEVLYIRGDRVLEADILRSIWDEICRATHIIVDLTGLNANVALELGIAHTLGRNVLLISQDRQPEKYFRAIAKQRIHPYALDSDSATRDFSSTLKKFLT
jgi:hypothetical protein